MTSTNRYPTAPPASRRDICEYLADDEYLEFSRAAKLGHQAIEGVVGATDRRLVFLTASERFRDLRYDDIRSIESRTESRLRLENHDYRLIVGGGAFLALVSFVGAIGASSGLMALALVVLTAAGLGVADYGVKRREEFDQLRIAEYPVQVIVITDGDGETQHVEIPGNRPIDTDLSRVIRSVG